MMRWRTFCVGTALSLLVASAQGEEFSVPDYSLEGMAEELADNLKVQVGKVAATGAVSDPQQQGPHYGQLGRLFMAHDLDSQAEFCLQRASQLQPHEPAWSYLRGLLAEQRGDFEAAISLFIQTLSARPDYLPAIAHLARLYRELGQFESADGVMGSMPAGPKASPAVAANWAEHWLETGREAQAIEPLLWALEAEPRANRLHYLLGNAYRSTGEYELAKQHFSQAGSIGLAIQDPYMNLVTQLAQSELLLIQRGNKAFEAGDYESAVEAFSQAVNQSPDSVRARVNLAAGLAESGNISGALSQLEQVLLIEPLNTTALYNAGRLRAQSGQLVEAEQAFSRLLSSSPQDYRAWLDQATVLKALSRNQQALAAALTAQSDPSLLVPALLLEVELRLAENQYQAAIDGLQKGLALAPDSISVAVTLANVLATAPRGYRNPDGARSLAVGVHQRSPSATTAEAVALALAASGQCEQSAQWLIQASTLAEQASNQALRLAAMAENMRAAQTCEP